MNPFKSCFCAIVAGLVLAAPITGLAEPGGVPGFVWNCGVLEGLGNGDGQMMASPIPGAWAGLRTLSGDFRLARAADGGECLENNAPGSVTFRVEKDVASGELVISPSASFPGGGITGVEWCVNGVPLEMNVIVPACSGLKFTRDTPGAEHVFDYPLTWEAPFVVFEGNGFGFCVWQEDGRGTFKRLRLKREADGWRASFTSHPFAPFDGCDGWESPPWRVACYNGDWRVPVRRYRDWMDTRFPPGDTPNPSWTRDIRACVIMGLQEELLEPLARRLDPKQTLLYVYDWRGQGYDRDYPEYGAYQEGLKPMLDKARALGFRIMLHVNYFGCDPLNPQYKQFEPFQVRGPWGNHERQWWEWPANPPIKFAYINPAAKAWRDLLVGRFADLCAALPVDALHLDQTLCIENDHNGLVDGMSMITGSLALHRELRAALPEVAISGEGLNEVTCVFEAFAQRHVWGLDHARGTYNTTRLRMSHPVSSYLLQGRTTLYGYLGYAPPSDVNMYAAWNEAYRNYGVIPTIKPDRASMEGGGFAAHFFTEAGLWFSQKPVPALDGPWPAEAAFPFVTAGGKSLFWTRDRRLLLDSQEKARVVSGVRETETGVVIQGWRSHDGGRMLNLDPNAWYPATAGGTRQENKFHVASTFPDGFALGAVRDVRGFASVHAVPFADPRLSVASLLSGGICSSIPDNGGAGQTQKGGLQSQDGAKVEAGGDHISVHPPYVGGAVGVVVASIPIRLSGNVARFHTLVALETGAEGPDRSDGVLFRVSAVAKNGMTASAETLNSSCSPKPLELDLSGMAGMEVTLTLAADPGPARNPSYDWAVWQSPRLECKQHCVADVTLGGVSGHRWLLAGSSVREIPAGTDTLTTPMDFPGGLCLLGEAPPHVALPADLIPMPRMVSCWSDSGMELQNPMHAGVFPVSCAVGASEKPSLLAHPPEHGRTRADFLLSLPSAAVFHALAGIRDGAEGMSNGVTFSVEANGAEQFRRKVEPGEWTEITVPLDDYSAGPLVLSLITDADGSFACDWACWGEPSLTAH